jgi:signal peptide peptidase SppA
MTDPHKMPASFRAALDRALARPLLLDQRVLFAVAQGAGFRPRADGGDMPEMPPSDRKKPYTVDGDVAIVSIEGPLAQRAWSCWIFEGDGYDAIAERVSAALGDPSIRAVVLRIDSPGGEVAGCFEAVRSIRSAAQSAGKPLTAFVDEMACSAAYALACACDRVVLPDTGCVGSVGVILALMEESKALDMVGITPNVITSGAAKADGHPAIPLSPDARARLQAEVDQLARVFAQEVANGRALDAQEALALEAQIFYGAEAIKRGLADQIGNLRSAIADARLSADRRGVRTRTAMDPLKSLLGMSAEATDAQVFERVTALSALERDALSLTDTKSAEEARGALRSIAKRASEADAAEAALQEERKTRVASERAALKKAGVEKAILSPADIDADGKGTEARWLAELSNTGLAAYLEREERTGRKVVPQGAINAPTEPPSNDAQMPPEIATLAAKGWKNLSSREKHTIEKHSAVLAARLRKQD